MSRTFKLVITLLSSAAVVSYIGCGSKKDTDDPLVEPERSGSPYVSTSLEYYEANPSLNDAGDKIVFVSGKLAEGETTPVLKIYKADWAVDAAPSTPERATTSDGTLSEKEAVFSQKGDFIAILGVTDGQVDLYLQDWAGSSDLVQITNDAATESNISFVSNATSAKLISYLSTDAAGVNKVVVIDVAAGTTEDMSDDNKKSLAVDSIEDLFFLSSSSAPYTLVTSTLDASTMAKIFAKRSLSFAADIETATSQNWLESFPHDDSVAVSANSTTVALTKRVVPLGTKTSTRSGDRVEPEDTEARTFNVKVEPSFITVADGSEKTFVSPPGFNIHSLSLTADGQNALWVVQQGYHCEVEGSDLKFVTALAFGKTDGSSSSWIIPRTTEEDASAWNIVTGFCDVTVVKETTDEETTTEEITAVIDDKITAAVINGASTTSDYRIVYSSRYSTVADGDGVLKTGDPELWVIDYSGTASTVYRLLSNQATIE